MSLRSTLPTEERASERLSHFPKVMQLEMGEPGLETQGHVPFKGAIWAPPPHWGSASQVGQTLSCLFGEQTSKRSQAVGM